MAYTINLTNGTTLTTVQDGTVNTTSCSLTLIGKNYAGYGTFFNDNLVHLLENSSDNTAPSTPLTGQLWWDTAGNLKVYTGSQFKTLASTTSDSSEPSNPVTGNFWWNTTDQQLYTYNGSDWVLIGPDTAANLGDSGILFSNITDSLGNEHVAANILVNNTLIGIISSSEEYTPQTIISGYGNIKPGFNLISPLVLENVTYWGSAENANKLGNIAASNYARTDQATTFTNDITSNSSIKVGLSSNIVTNLNGLNARITNTQNLGNLTLRANVLGTVTDSINISGTTGNIELAGNLTTTSNITTSKVITASSAIIGSSITTGSINVMANVNVTNTVVTNKLSTTASSSLSGNVILNGSEILTDGSAVNLQVTTSYFSTTGAWDATLAAGAQGQIKILMMLADGGDMVVTVTNPAWTGAGTLTFNTVGQACTLQYMANKWFVIGNNGVTIA